MVAILRGIDRIQATSEYGVPKTKPKHFFWLLLVRPFVASCALRQQKKSDGSIGSETVTDGGRVVP
jgi:hypothetical protein